MPLSVTIKLNEKDVENILKEHLRKEGYETSTFRFKVEQRGTDPRDLDLHYAFVGIEADAVKKA